MNPVCAILITEIPKSGRLAVLRHGAIGLKVLRGYYFIGESERAGLWEDLLRGKYVETRSDLFLLSEIYPCKFELNDAGHQEAVAFLKSIGQYEYFMINRKVELVEDSLHRAVHAANFFYAKT